MGTKEHKENSSHTVSYEEYCRMKEFFLGQLAEKDKTIEDMKTRNAILLKSALKQSEKNMELSSHSKALLELNKKLERKSLRT